MNDVICISDLRRMFAEAAKKIRQDQAILSQLDCIGGDGDHGTTMVRAMKQLEDAMKDENAKPLNARLKDASWSVLGVDGGASSAILGSFIAGMGDAEMGQESDCGRLAASLTAGLEALRKQTRAIPGDKTMMDAFVPAVQAFAAAANSGESIANAMEYAAEAARRGADATKDMIAKYGRARFLGEKTRGSPDAGATSVALLFAGFSAALMQEKEA
ncbi:MAG TPA: dihydroxyacetone kinase subunit DhaL [Terracidiphilus sp.]|nr:dihydroxyacetone kinase subunit DhaL [Terracidiphilus sp.]